MRTHNLTQDRGTNYGVVRLELLESIYSDLYTQRLKYSREDEWPHRILNHCAVTGWDDLPNNRIALTVRRDADHDGPSKGTPSVHILSADVVIVATGYRRDAHEGLLKSTRHLLPNSDHDFSVGRDYKVEFRNGAIKDDAGIWLQGCNESSHGVRKRVKLPSNSTDVLTSFYSSAILCFPFLQHEGVTWFNLCLVIVRTQLKANEQYLCSGPMVGHLGMRNTRIADFHYDPSLNPHFQSMFSQ